MDCISSVSFIFYEIPTIQKLTVLEMISKHCFIWCICSRKHSCYWHTAMVVVILEMPKVKFRWTVVKYNENWDRLIGKRNEAFPFTTTFCFCYIYRLLFDWRAFENIFKMTRYENSIKYLFGFIPSPREIPILIIYRL